MKQLSHHLRYTEAQFAPLTGFDPFADTSRRGDGTVYPFSTGSDLCSYFRKLSGIAHLVRFH